MITNELYDITHAGDLKGASQWLDQKPDDLNANISDGFTPLHVACMFGYEPIVHHLVSRGALVNANARNDARMTPLHLATAFRVEDVAQRLIQFLVSHGAELNAKQAGGQTALHHAVGRGSTLLTKTLIDEGADPFLKDEQGRSAKDLAETEDLQTVLKGAFSLPLES